MALEKGSKLSARGSSYLTGAGGHSAFHSILDDIYHPETNPDGILSLGLAENSLMHDELLKYINDSFEMSSHYLMYGDGASGSKRLRAAIAGFVNHHFNPVSALESKHVQVTLGVSNANEMIAFVLGNPGDGFLLGRPYYGAFIGDFKARAGVETVGVAFGSTDPFSIEAVSKYEEALLRSNSEGVPIKALILCTPNNPLGRCYPRHVIIELMKLCQKYQIHLVSDEIYALSVWDNPAAADAPPFTSVLSIDPTGIIDPSLVHAMWGMSKDFGANGLRIGCILSPHNAPFLLSLREISLVNYPPAPSDLIATTVLSNPSFTDPYIHTNRARIAAAHAFAANWLSRHGIPVHAAGCNAGFFLWVDLRAAVMVGREGKVYEHDVLCGMLAERRVFVADALKFGGEEEGWFRVVFTHPKGFMERALGRLGEVVEAYRARGG